MIVCLGFDHQERSMRTGTSAARLSIVNSERYRVSYPVIMPELPEIELYVEALRHRTLNQTVKSFSITSPFLLRTVEPPIESVVGEQVCDVVRMGKRIVFALTSELRIVVHLMIAGRLDWKEAGSAVKGKSVIMALSFDTGELIMTESSKKKWASIHLVKGESACNLLDPGGLEVLDADLKTFRKALLKEHRTLKRALTDPRILSGIGHAYSDEILHAARLSPAQITPNLSDEEFERLFNAAKETLRRASRSLRDKTGDGFPSPKIISATGKDFAVHNQFGKPCRVCNGKIQRIRYAENETNYCPNCQTGGSILGDRSLSRLMKSDWPRTVDELENPC